MAIKKAQILRPSYRNLSKIKRNIQIFERKQQQKYKDSTENIFNYLHVNDMNLLNCTLRAPLLLRALSTIKGTVMQIK